MTDEEAWGRQGEDQDRNIVLSMQETKPLLTENQKRAQRILNQSLGGGSLWAGFLKLLWRSQPWIYYRTDGQDQRVFEEWSLL